MAHEITIPRLGWNMEEGIFQGWLKRDGDTVRAGDMIFALEGEKATEEIECLESGVLRFRSGGPKVGDRVVVGAVIGAVVQSGEEYSFSEEKTSAKPPSELRGRVAVDKVKAGAPRKERAISPRARRVARELGVDCSALQGTGLTGRIRERDVRAAKPAAALSLTRRIIAERMKDSLANTSPVTLTTTLDATELVKLRERFKAAGSEGAPTYTDILVNFAGVALRKHPSLIVRWEGDRLVTPTEIHIGIAVDTDAGLLVPVIRDADALSLEDLAARSRDLIERARHGKLVAADMQCGVFTVTNLGAFGIDAFTSIINYPECAILGVGRIVKVPAVVDDQVAPRDCLTLSLTFDHRRVDGAPAARFLQTLSRIIENPGPHLMSLP